MDRRGRGVDPTSRVVRDGYARGGQPELSPRRGFPLGRSCRGWPLVRLPTFVWWWIWLVGIFHRYVYANKITMWIWVWSVRFHTYRIWSAGWEELLLYEKGGTVYPRI